MDLVLTREFAWSRFQEQSELNGCKPCEFQMAIEEALLAENGFTEKLIKMTFSFSIVNALRWFDGIFSFDTFKN